MLQGDIFGWLISRAKDGTRFYSAQPSPTSPEKIGIFADVTVGDLAKRQPTKAVRRSPAMWRYEEPSSARTAQGGCGWKPLSASPYKTIAGPATASFFMPAKRPCRTSSGCDAN